MARSDGSEVGGEEEVGVEGEDVAGTGAGVDVGSVVGDGDGEVDGGRGEMVVKGVVDVTATIASSTIAARVVVSRASRRGPAVSNHCWNDVKTKLRHRSEQFSLSSNSCAYSGFSVTNTVKCLTL